MAEVELKLNLPKAQKTAALKHLSGLPGAETPKTEHLVSTYFDTAAGALRAAGYTLRVRSDGERYTQTIKSLGDGGLSREEFEDTVNGNAPSRDVGESGWKLQKLLSAKAKLQPLFQVTVARETVMLRRKQSIIAASIDTGRVLTPEGSGPDRAAPISEMEFECKEGSEADLYELALKLLGSLDLVPEPRSKAERGEALRADAGPKTYKSDVVPLHAKASTGEALSAIGQGYLHQFARNIPAALDRQESAIHQMRVALRRLRGVLKALEKLLHPLPLPRIENDLKRMLQALGNARNWDVLHEMLLSVPDLANRRMVGHARLRAAILREKRSAHAAACAAVTSKGQNRTTFQVMRWFLALPQQADTHPALATPFEKLAKQMLNGQFKRVRRRGKNYAGLDAEARHKLRIACKTLRYNVELCGQLYPRKKVKVFLKLLKPLQDDLGALNDVHTAHAMLAPLRASSSADVAGEVDALLGWLDHDVRHLEKKAARHVEKLLKAKAFW